MPENEPGVSLAALRRSQAENARERDGKVEATITAIDLTVWQWSGVLVRIWLAYLLLLVLFVGVPMTALATLGWLLSETFESSQQDQ